MYDTTTSMAHVVMELMDKDLCDIIIEKKETFSEKEAIPIIIGILRALQHLHSMHIVHRYMSYTSRFRNH